VIQVIKQWTIVILATSIVLLTGCRELVLHPIQKLDIQRVEKGEEFIPPLDGYFFSDKYVKEVMSIKVEK